MAQSLVSVAHPLAEKTDTGHNLAANMIREVPSRCCGVPEGEAETLGSCGKFHRPGSVWDGV